MAEIVEGARLKLDERLESARLRNSRELIGGIKHIYLLVGTGAAMNQITPEWNKLPGRRPSCQKSSTSASSRSKAGWRWSTTRATRRPSATSTWWTTASHATCTTTSTGRRPAKSTELLSPYAKELLNQNKLKPCKTEKLVPFLGIHRKEGVDEKLLKFMIEVMGTRIERVREVINFECRPFLAEWMREIYRERLEMKRQGRLVEAEMLKLVMNAIYGKLVCAEYRRRSALRAKLYTVRFHDDKDEQKSKGIMARARPKHEDYRATMETGLEAPVTFSQMQSRNFIMAIINFKKKALSPLNDKVFQINALERLRQPSCVRYSFVHCRSR